VKVAHVVDDYLHFRRDVWERFNDPEQYKGVPTGFKLIDNCEDWGGTYKGDLYLCLGFTKRGKSFFLMEVGYQAAMRGYKVVHVTIEMTARKALTRFYSRVSGVPYSAMKSPQKQSFDDEGNIVWHPVMTDEYFHQLDSSIKMLRDKKIVYYILSFDKGICVADIEEELRRLPFKPDVLTIDHLPDMKPDPSYRSSGGSRSWDSLGQVSWEMSQLARNWDDQNGLIIWTANQVKADYEYAERLTVEACAFSKLPIYHAAGTVYLTQTEEDESMDIRRFGIINARDSANLSDIEYLTSNLDICMLNDYNRLEDSFVRQYLRRIQQS